MARITGFAHLLQQRCAVHPTEVTCRIADFSVGRNRFLQLSTFGSATRQDEGTVSQTLQLNERAARELKSILERTFPD